jgi:hypothetical protein
VLGLSAHDRFGEIASFIAPLERMGAGAGICETNADVKLYGVIDDFAELMTGVEDLSSNIAVRSFIFLQTGRPSGELFSAIHLQRLG